MLILVLISIISCVNDHYRHYVAHNGHLGGNKSRLLLLPPLYYTGDKPLARASVLHPDDGNSFIVRTGENQLEKA